MATKTKNAVQRPSALDRMRKKVSEEEVEIKKNPSIYLPTTTNLYQVEKRLITGHHAGFTEVIARDPYRAAYLVWSTTMKETEVGSEAPSLFLVRTYEIPQPGDEGVVEVKTNHARLYVLANGRMEEVDKQVRV